MSHLATARARCHPADRTEAHLVLVPPLVDSMPPTNEKPGVMRRIKSWPCTRARVEGLTVGFILGISTAAQMLVNMPR